MPQRRSWLVLILLCLTLSAQAAPALIPSPPRLDASAWILMDADSGHVIVEHNADEPLPPASLTKMMTSYILSYEEAEGRVSPDDPVTVSRQAWAQNFPGSSLMWIEVGTQVSLMDLHRGIVISSGNDACVAVAEHLAGSEEAFADLMNAHAERLGMTHSHFVNSHGLPAEGHVSTARDMAILARAIIRDFPEDYKLYREKSFTYNNIPQTNRNRLLWRDKTVDGLKTGHTEAAGYCLVASAKRRGMRLISVVMGTDSEEARVRETQKLLAYGFRFYETHTLYQAGETLNTATVWGGQGDTASLGLADAVVLTIPRGQRSDVAAKLTLDPVIRAPVAVGETYGTVEIRLNDEVLATRPLVALEAVPRAGLVSRLWDEVRLFFHNLLRR